MSKQSLNSRKKARKFCDRSIALANRMTQSIDAGQSPDYDDLVDAILFRRESLSRMHHLYADEFEQLLFRFEVMVPEARSLWVRSGRPLGNTVS